MRLFAGLPLPVFAKDQLAKVRLRLSAPGDGLRWSAPEQWHITLKFFGEVEEARVAAVPEALAAVRCAPAEVEIRELGMFGAKGILFASVEVSAGLGALYEAVEREAARCGMVPESRAFRPHITLARSKGPKGVAALRRVAAPELPSLGPPMRWVADEVVLYRSVLRPGGSEYTVVQSVGLGEAGTEE